MRAALRSRLGDVRYLVRLRVLPRRVARFQWRAYRRASRIGDWFSPASATRPDDLAALLKLARGRQRVVELGTGTGWTAIALALDDADREVITFDPIDRPERERYMALAEQGVLRRITFVNQAGSIGPRDDRPIDLLYVDSSHERQETVDELHAWLPALRPGALLVLDDFDHPEYPGVGEAIRALGLEGRQCGTLFVCSP